MLHPAQSINPYHKAPTPMTEYTDVPLIDRESERNMSDGRRRREKRLYVKTDTGGDELSCHQRKNTKLSAIIL